MTFSPFTQDISLKTRENPATHCQQDWSDCNQKDAQQSLEKDFYRHDDSLPFIEVS